MEGRNHFKYADSFTIAKWIQSEWGLSVTSVASQEDQKEQSVSSEENKHIAAQQYFKSYIKRCLRNPVVYRQEFLNKWQIVGFNE